MSFKINLIISVACHPVESLTLTEKKNYLKNRYSRSVFESYLEQENWLTTLHFVLLCNKDLKKEK